MSQVIDDNGCTLFQGDFRNALAYVRDVDLILTSPPYNIGSAGPAKTGLRKMGLYDPKSFRSIQDYADSLPEADYQREQHDFLVWCAERLQPDGVIIYNHKPRHKNGVLIKPEEWFPTKDVLVLHDEVVWDRGSTHNHAKQFVYPQTERLYVLKRPGAQIHFENQNFFWRDSEHKGVGDVWRIPPDRSNEHNAPMPLRLARQCVRMWSPRGGLVCDPYSGSGTTLVASVLEDRRFVGSEMLLENVMMARRRLSEELLEVA